MCSNVGCKREYLFNRNSSNRIWKGRKTAAGGSRGQQGAAEGRSSREQQWAAAAVAAAGAAAAEPASWGRGQQGQQWQRQQQGQQQGQGQQQQGQQQIRGSNSRGSSRAMAASGAGTPAAAAVQQEEVYDTVALIGRCDGCQDETSWMLGNNSFHGINRPQAQFGQVRTTSVSLPQMP